MIKSLQSSNFTDADLWSDLGHHVVLEATIAHSTVLHMISSHLVVVESVGTMMSGSTETKCKPLSHDQRDLSADSQIPFSSKDYERPDVPHLGLHIANNE